MNSHRVLQQPKHIWSVEADRATLWILSGKNDISLFGWHKTRDLKTIVPATRLWSRHPCSPTAQTRIQYSKKSDQSAPSRWSISHSQNICSQKGYTVPLQLCNLPDIPPDLPHPKLHTSSCGRRRPSYHSSVSKEAFSEETLLEAPGFLLSQVSLCRHEVVLQVVL